MDCSFPDHSLFLSILIKKCNDELRSIFNFSSKFQNQDEIILRDYLALERTKLANERTLLSYIRSSLYLLLGGIAIIQLNGFESIKFLGYPVLWVLR